MKAFVLLFALSSFAFSQYRQVGRFEQTSIENGHVTTRILTVAEVYGSADKNLRIISPIHKSIAYPLAPEFQQHPDLLNNSMIRWTFIDPVAIAGHCQTSANGYQTVGYGLNTERVSLYTNASNTPLWEYSVNPNTFDNYVAISDTGGVIAAGAYQNIYLFNRSSSTPFFNLDLTAITEPGTAGPLDLASNGRFLVATCNRTGSDSSSVFGFWRDSTNWVWRFKVGPLGSVGSALQGVKLSGNDSLVIVNTYSQFYVLRTYTGQLVYQGLINPISQTSGTQMAQGISGNGSIIATINYHGYLRVYQWNGSTYNLLWQHQEPPGTYYNWMSAVDISYDGSMIACGTLQFITTSSYDGKLKFFRTANGSTPIWTYTGFGDEVTSVSFSKNGNILSGCSWGDYYNPSVYDLLVWKISTNANVPIFRTDSPGSFYQVSTSEDGSTVFASGKRVHAREFGNGGQVYNVFIDTNDSPVSILPIGSGIPAQFRLEQNYPNPFNPNTTIEIHLPKSEYASLKIYDMLGREVLTLISRELTAGRYQVEFDGKDIASGIYYYQLEAGGFRAVRKMALIR